MLACSVFSGGRKGWLPAYRDSVMFKLAYSYGLRLNELRHLQTVDFARNPHAREFGRYGLVHVRYGKAKKGSPPKRRSVLTVFDWTPEVIGDWLAYGQPHMDDGIDLFPSERGALVSQDPLLRRFRRYCTDLELSAGLDLHSLRRSYATHLIEDGWDPMFVQHQMGHEHASTTALYTCVSSDFRIRTLRRVEQQRCALGAGAVLVAWVSRMVGSRYGTGGTRPFQRHRAVQAGLRGPGPPARGAWQHTHATRSGRVARLVAFAVIASTGTDGGA
jgi:integrase